MINRLIDDENKRKLEHYLIPVPSVYPALILNLTHF